jgi:transposase-like protein
VIAQQNAQPKTLIEAVRYFSDPNVCDGYIASIKWPNGDPVCRCGSTEVAYMEKRRRFHCRKCRHQFSIKTGTIFESSPLSLSQWLVAAWMIANCKNGVSSCEIARALGIKQQSAWHLLHRIRYVIRPGWADYKLKGEVESDTTYIGGRMKFKSRATRAKNTKHGGPSGKASVHALLQRGGEVRAMVVKRNTNVEIHESDNVTLDICVRHVEPGAKLYTDQARAYTHAHKVFDHEWVNHMFEYVKGSCHTNSLENFFCLLRRALGGSYVSVDPQHLSAYIDEQSFRFNTRKESDWMRFDRLMRKVVNRRLMYHTLTGGKTR